MTARDVMLRALCKVESEDPNMPCFDRDEIDGRRFRACVLCDRSTDAIIAALDAAGFAVVPKEPTEAMFLATCDAWEYHGSGFDQFKREYKAMLAAAKLSETKQEETT